MPKNILILSTSLRKDSNSDALAAAFASPEPLDARWPELLRRAAALPACPPPRMTPMQQTCLAQTIVWRHGMDALDDRDVVFPVRYAAATLRLLDCLAAGGGRTASHRQGTIWSGGGERLHGRAARRARHARGGK